MLPISKQPRLIKYAFSNPRKNFSKEDGKRENSHWKRKFKWAHFNLDFVLLLFEDLFYLIVYYRMEYSVVGFVSFCFALCVGGVVLFLCFFLRMKNYIRRTDRKIYSGCCFKFAKLRTSFFPFTQDSLEDEILCHVAVELQSFTCTSLEILM